MTSQLLEIKQKMTDDVIKVQIQMKQSLLRKGAVKIIGVFGREIDFFYLWIDSDLGVAADFWIEIFVYAFLQNRHYHLTSVVFC